MKHEPIVIERSYWRTTKAACSCGEELQLPGNVGSVREQSRKLVTAFQKHKTERKTVRQKPLQSAMPNSTEMNPVKILANISA
jgi:hypothetical protein